jgi:hypothetical protein
MKPLIQIKTTIPSLLVSVLLVCFGLLPRAQAVGPDTDGTIPGSNDGEGIGVLVSRTTGVWNSGTGFEALNHLTAGNQNTATGLRALFSDINGGFNTATGVFSLFSNTSGFFNSATGAYALANNVSGNYNTANGYGALYRNTTGIRNTAIGFGALFVNTTGGDNTANGANALGNNTTGASNAATGRNALLHNTTGDNNTAFGETALFSNTTGNLNTAVGTGALNNTTGSNNTAFGVGAGTNVTTANNVIAIGTDGANVSDSCFIGNIFGATASSGTAVFINSSGQLGTVTSSRRFKKEIKPMDSASESILGLKPVTFRYKKDIDPDGIPQFGLVAEDVEKVNPDLVVRDKEGKPYTVRYDQVNAMLLNEFLKEHDTVLELKKEIAALTATVKEQATQIQKVSTQVELSNPAPQMVVNNP